MTILDSAIKTIRERPGIILLTLCAFFFFYAVIYFAFAMIFSSATRNMALWAAFVGSVCITGAMVKRQLDDA